MGMATRIEEGHDGRHENCRHCGTSPRQRAARRAAELADALRVPRTPGCWRCAGTGWVLSVMGAPAAEQAHRCGCAHNTRGATT